MDVRVCDWRNVWAYPDRQTKPWHTDTHTHIYRCVCALWQNCSWFLCILGEKTARQASIINMLIYAATSSFHYAYIYHWGRVCSLFLMYESLSCREQGQNQQSCVDLCSSWFPATIVHQGGTNAVSALPVVGWFFLLYQPQNQLTQQQSLPLLWPADQNSFFSVHKL